MPFDSTPGGSSSTSYLSVERADEIASERLHATSWDGLTTQQKQAALIFASRLFTSRVCVLGEAANEDQALLFPRTGLYNRNGVEIDDATIPADVEYAVFEWALRIIPSDTTVESDISLQGINRIKAGPVELGFKSEIVNSGSSVPANVLAMIPAGWLCPAPVDWSSVSVEFRVL